MLHKSGSSEQHGDRMLHSAGESSNFKLSKHPLSTRVGYAMTSQLISVECDAPIKSVFFCIRYSLEGVYTKMTSKPQCNRIRCCLVLFVLPKTIFERLHLLAPDKAAISLNGCYLAGNLIRLNFRKFL